MGVGGWGGEISNSSVALNIGNNSLCDRRSPASEDQETTLSQELQNSKSKRPV